MRLTKVQPNGQVICFLRQQLELQSENDGEIARAFLSLTAWQQHLLIALATNAVERVGDEEIARQWKMSVSCVQDLRWATFRRLHTMLGLPTAVKKDVKAEMAHSWLGADIEGRRVASILHRQQIQTPTDVKQWLDSGRPIRGIGRKSLLMIRQRLQEAELLLAS